MDKVSLDEALKSLKSGFRFSFAALILTALYSILAMKGYALLLLSLFGFPLFLLLSIWSYGLAERVKGWSMLSQKRIALALICGAITLVTSFSLATAPYIIPLGSYPLGTGLQSLFAFLFYLGVFVAPIAWAIYTASESCGFKTLKQKFGVNLTLTRIFSLTSILVFALALTIQYLIGCFSIYPIPVFPLITPLLFSSPLLIASCISAILNLRKTLNEK